MRKTLGVLTTSIALVGGLSGGTAAADDTAVVVQPDRAHDVQIKKPGTKSEKAPRFIKQSVDIKQVRYRVNRTTNRLRITTKARNVLQANRRRDQRFLTYFSDSDRYSFAWVQSTNHGPVEVWNYDRGGTYKVPCPRAEVKLLPGKRKERVVQSIPLNCIQLTKRIYAKSRATVVPFNPKRFVSRDYTRETDLIKVG